MIQELSILFIEDDIVETMKMNRTINKLEVPYKIQEAKNGEQALDILNKGGELPDIILLDLNMPRMDGREALQAIKANPCLKGIPVVILTTSKQEEDMVKGYDLGAASYITKPVTFDGLVELMKALGKYWVEFVELPNTYND